MNFKRLHLYDDSGALASTVDVAWIKEQLASLIPYCECDTKALERIENQFSVGTDVGRAIITDTKHPFEGQPSSQEQLRVRGFELYDGYEFQAILSRYLNPSEGGLDDLHIVLTERLLCTFDYEGYRYHARTVICGSPSIISIPGIVFAPARPREYYLAEMTGQLGQSKLKEAFEGQFIDFGDSLVSSVALGLILQCVFYFLRDGQPFCDDRNCRLFNSHWQKDLIHSQSKYPGLCSVHDSLLRSFNAILQSAKKS